MNINKKHILIFTCVVYGAVFFMCMSNNIVGPLLSNIMQHYSIQLDNGGLMSMFQNIGGTVAIILLSLLIDKLNKTVAYIVPMFLLGVSMLVLGLAPPYTYFMILFLFFGISFSTMDMIGNAIVADVQHERKDAALSLMHGVASIGAVAAPMIAGGITEAGLPWQNVYTAVGGLILLLLVIYLFAFVYAKKSLKALKAHHAEKTDKGAAKAFLRDKRVWIAVGCVFVFGGYQSGILVWVSQYFKDVFGSGQIAAGLALTAYWLGAGIVRVLFGITPLKKLDTRPLMIYGSIAAGVALFIGVLSQNYYVMLVCVFLSGALNAPLLPRSVGLVSGWYRHNSGLSSSSVFGALYLAYAFIPLLMGSAAYAWGMDFLIVIPAVCTVLAGVLAVFLPKKEPKPTGI